MSWSFQAAGTPEAVSRQLDHDLANYSEGSPSRDEFESALPCLRGLILANSGSRIVKVNAYGSQTRSNGVLVDGQCTVQIEPIYISAK